MWCGWMILDIPCFIYLQLKFHLNYSDWWAFYNHRFHGWLKKSILIFDSFPAHFCTIADIPLLIEDSCMACKMTLMISIGGDTVT